MTPPHMRAGTTDRQDAVDRLSQHFTEGRLDPTEFDVRVGKAYAATYLDELPELLADLPEARRELAVPMKGWPRGAPGSRLDRPYGDDRPEGRGSALQRPPRWLGVAVLVGVLFTVGVLTQGLFLFPLLWLAFALSAAGHRRRHWEGRDAGRRYRR